MVRLPSVDGLILAASLVLLHEARNDRDAPRLARFMLWRGDAEPQHEPIRLDSAAALVTMAASLQYAAIRSSRAGGQAARSGWAFARS
jgi:hypothetical protein